MAGNVAHKDDLALAQALIAGDEQKFNEFFNQYFPRLFRFAKSRMDDDSAIEDIVQTTMMNAMRSIASYRGEAAMFTWLCQICRNEINMHYRKHARRAPEVPADDDGIRPILEQLESLDSPDDDYESTQIRQLIVEILDFLPGNYGQALEWKYILGLSVTEIAERLDTTDLAAQSLLARARSAFKSAIKQVSPQLGYPGQET
ncbi:MAG: sigma-70 family RNA polymerase sigma factor [Proteobacteria bacterium]|nr:sigma-70 family RNA polymerase sigma factor [Pseudomonadota bacterium]